ncbi:MAG: hypothetical protein AAF206_14490 [Bacteroidota bacterium]
MPKDLWCMGGKKRLVPRTFAEAGNTYLAVTLKHFLRKIHAISAETVMDELSALYAPEVLSAHTDISQPAPFRDHIYHESRKLQLIWEISCREHGDVQVSWLEDPAKEEWQRAAHLLRVAAFLAHFGCEIPEMQP